MRVLVIGGGAREHALCEAVARNDADLFAFMKNANPGIKRLAREYLLHDECDAESVCTFACRHRIDLAVIGPEAPEESGVANGLADREIAVASPTREAAEIETDKAFMRNLMKKYRINGSVKCQTFTRPSDARKFIEELDGHVAVKPVGLTGGKGFRIAGDHFSTAAEAAAYAEAVIEQKIGGRRAVLVRARSTMLAGTDPESASDHTRMAA
jgi:phosphoribosylamine--glycine ligase